MARNLLKTGHELELYNRTSSRAEALQRLGAQVADTPAQAVGGVEVVITMLADDRAVEAVVFESGQILKSLPGGTIHVSMSTISVALSSWLAAAHRHKQQHYVAAPVFGKPKAAAAAKLVIIAAGPTDAVERCRPLFTAVGQQLFVVGEEASSANVIKLAGNFLITTVIESLAEAFALAKQSQINPSEFLCIVIETLLSCSIYRNYGGMIAANRFEPPGFKLPLGLKDTRLVFAAAEDVAVPMPMASVVHDHFLAAIAQGLANADWAPIARVSYRNAGL